MREEVKCQCGRTSPIDLYTDGGYLLTQYGWDIDNSKDGKEWSCPVCNYGLKKGTKLILKLQEIYTLRKQQ